MAQHFQLLCERPPRPIEHGARSRFQQHPIGFAQLIDIQSKDAAAPVEPGLAVLTDEDALELTAQFLPVRRSLLIKNDQVNLDAPIAPVDVRLERLLHQRQVFRCVHPHQQDGIIAGNAKAPQPRLTLAILCECCGVRAQCGPRIDQGRQKLFDLFQVSHRQIELVQLQFGARPRLLKCPLNRLRFLIALG